MRGVSSGLGYACLFRSSHIDMEGMLWLVGTQAVLEAAAVMQS